MKSAATHDVFISHSTADEAWAKAVLDSLEAMGLSCWIAPRDIVAGQTWSGAIVAAIHGCRLMVLIFSHHSNESPQVTRELVQAAERGVHVLPLRVDDVQPSNDKAYYLGAAHWRSVLGGPTEENLAQLRKDVRQLLALPAGVDGTERKVQKKTSSRSSVRRLSWVAVVAVAVLGLSAWQFYFREKSPPDDPKPPFVEPEKKTDRPKTNPQDNPAPSKNQESSSTSNVDHVTPTPEPDVRWNEAPETLRKLFESLGGDWIETGDRSLPARIRHVATQMEFVLVPAGEFVLGAPSSDLDTRDEQPTLVVRMSAFYIARFEVSVAQYSARQDSTNLPVVDLTNQQAEEWCAKQGLALPTEAQWEYAASGTKNLTFPWGDTWKAGACNTAGESDGFRELAPIGSFHASESWCGAEDMAGNVAEWCRGSYVSGYEGHIGDKDPEPPSQSSMRVARGGSWFDRESGQRTSDRRPYQRGAHDGFVGFRCVFKP